MDHKIAICYFSGTGNTAFVVESARDEFVRCGVDVDLFKFEHLRRENGNEFNPSAYEMLGIAHPVLGFGCPGFITDFVQTLPLVENKPVFLLKTAGDFHAVNFSASHAMKQILVRKGYDPFYDDIFAMPVNWLLTYDDQLNRQMVEVVPTRVAATVRRILAHERRTLSNQRLVRLILGAIGYLEDREGARQFGRSLQANASCVQCGACVRNCPVGNIEIKNGRVEFGNTCAWCMRCVYNCPQKAIDSKYMNMFILKEGYSLARIRALAFKPIDFQNSGISFWHKYFRRYFEDQSE